MSIYRIRELLNIKNIPYHFDIFLNEVVFKNFPYLKYVVEKKKSNSKTYKLFNFYYGAKADDFRIVRFIELNKLNIHERKVDIFSVFGPRKLIKYSKNFKIFFTGEPIYEGNRFAQYNDYCLSDVDLSLGFRELSNSKYFRLPLWLFYGDFLKPDKTSLQDIRSILQSIDSIKNAKMKRNKFCSLISRHDDVNQTRFLTYKRLSKFGKISCPGRFLHNDDTKIPEYIDKINYMKNFKFNICPENYLDKGYVTEKLLDSLLAGCIPVYNGVFGELENKIFNKNRIIFIDENLEKNVEQLMSSEKLYKKFINQPIFNKGADSYIYEHIESFKEKLDELLLS